MAKRKVSEATSLELQAAHTNMRAVFSRENNTDKATTTEQQFNVIRRIEADLDYLIKKL